MNIESFREFCLSLPYTEECTPFDETTLVYKVGGKMFAFTDSEDFGSGFVVKCDPDEALALREKHPDDVLEGYHISKKHWNTIMPHGNLPVEFIREMIRNSYTLVRSKLPKSIKETLRD